MASVNRSSKHTYTSTDKIVFLGRNSESHHAFGVPSNSQYRLLVKFRLRCFHLLYQILCLPTLVSKIFVHKHVAYKQFICKLRIRTAVSSNLMLHLNPMHKFELACKTIESSNNIGTLRTFASTATK